MATRKPPADHLDGYSPDELGSSDPNKDPNVQAEVDKAARELARRSGRFDNVDGFKNELTGIGDPNQDKTYGGMTNGPEFLVRLLSGFECEDRWRGSDLGGRIIETLPDEMVREGWEINVQPEEGEEDEAPGKARADGFPDAQPPQAPKHTPGELPQGDDEGQAIVEELEAKQRELDVRAVVREALTYERAFGGSAILLGVDDGQKDLTQPLDETKIKAVRHLTAFRGGWDGELIAWRYYNDPRKPSFGKPEVYMLRNLGVPIAAPPAPGERETVPPVVPTGPTGALIFYVHESRLLIFPGTAVSRRARVQMRGWGDSVFTRVDEVLSQYGQTWGAVANLMTDWAQGVLSIDGLADLLTGPNADAGPGGGTGAVAKRMTAINLSKSIARTMLIDKEESFTREVTPLSGIADVLEQFGLRVAAAADMPLSLLMGQVKGGLGDAGNTDLRFFYDRIAARQEDRMLPQLRRLIRLILLSKEGPTKGREPKRWSVELRPLWQSTAKEEADLRKTVADADNIYITAGVVTPEEIAASRFGGSKWTMETVIDFDARKQMAKETEQQRQEQAAQKDVQAQRSQELHEQKIAQGKASLQAQGALAKEPGAQPPPAKEPLKVTSLKKPDDKQDAGNWDPDKHPRAQNGQFGSGGGGASSGSPKGEHGTDRGLGIPRSAMPQIRSNDVPEFLGTLRAKGIKVEPAHERVGDLKPTQGELNPDKVEAMKGKVKANEKPIIVSSDGHILDGHHRWAGLKAEDPDQKIPVYKVDLPIHQLLKEAHDFPKAEKHGVEEGAGPRAPQDPSGRAQIPKVATWEAHHDSLPEQTWQTTMTGNPDKDKSAHAQPWRQPLHDKIMSEALDNVHPVPAGEQKVAILTMGGPASGKTTLVNKMLGVAKNRFVSVDPDSIKEQFPEYRAATGLDWKPGDPPRAAARDAAWMAHEESSYLAKKITARAIAEGKHVVIDGTGANADKMTNLAARLKENGYQVHLVYADLDAQEGLSRIEKRAQSSGRFVPTSVALDTYEKAPKNFQTIAKSADSFTVYNASGAETKKAWSRALDGTETLHDPDFVASFKAKNWKE